MPFQNFCQTDEEEYDPMDDGDYAYDSWKDKQMEEEHA